MNQLDWVSGLDESGWVAAVLFVAFFIITIVISAMMWKMREDNKKEKRAKKQGGVKKSPSTPRKPVPAKTAAKKPEKKENYSNPIEEAEIFLTYGLNKQAIDLLEKYLEKNPSDKNARELLNKAQS